MGYYHLKLLSPRATFPFDMNEREKQAMTEHSHYWQRLAEKHRAVVVGPVFDPKGAYGMAIVETENEAEAEALASADPVITASLGFRYEVSPMPSLIIRDIDDL
ncbi:MAG: hypothetical protein JWM58_413 [Rhizobium sp.]|nr:hypothetical protein [Rhizobium sp.]